MPRTANHGLYPERVVVGRRVCSLGKPHSIGFISKVYPLKRKDRPMDLSYDVVWLKNPTKVEHFDEIAWKLVDYDAFYDAVSKELTGMTFTRNKLDQMIGSQFPGIQVSS